MNKSKILGICLLFFVLNAKAQQGDFSSQSQPKVKHSLVAYVSGGFSLYLSNDGAPFYLRPDVNNFNPMANIRVMWHPDHLLNVGLETGYLTFYSYTFLDSIRTSGKIRLRAIPVLVEWSMAVTKRLNLFVGSGLYFLATHLDYKGKSKGNKVSIGWMAAGSYIHPISPNLGLGAEIKWMDAAETANGVLIGQVQLVWRFKSWK